MAEIKTKGKIIIPDTNFIIEHGKNFVEVLKILSKFGVVYVSEITINERIAQEKRGAKEAYQTIENVSKKHGKYATVTLKKELSKVFEEFETGMLKLYKSVIGENIIKFPHDDKIFSVVLQRAYDKTPPFSREKKGSDKGFKDTLLWLSLLDFFKINGEDNEIILITDDGGFKNDNNIDILKKEFNDTTGKQIQIVGNEYYKTLIEDSTISKSDKKVLKKELDALDLEKISKEIKETVINICETVDIDSYGNPYETYTFSLHHQIMPVFLKERLEKIDEIILANIFEEEVPASLFFGKAVYRDIANISIKNYKAFSDLYKKISELHSDYIPQFLKAACNLINRLYSNSSGRQLIIEDDKLPF